MAKKSARYRTSKRAFPEGVAGQRRAVYEAIKKGAGSAEEVREAVRSTAAFKGVSAETLKNNVSWYVARLRRDGFIAKGGTK